MKPLLLLDVDGPLNPFRLITKNGYLLPKQWRDEPRFAYEKHLMDLPGWDTGESLPVLLSVEMGDQLAGLQDVFTLVWATTWEHEANKWLSPILGLPTLPVIVWPSDAQEWTLRAPRHTGSWKTRHILRWLGDCAVGPDGKHLPWVWIDDDIRSDDRRAVRAHYGEQRGGPQTVRRWLLHIEPSHGLRRRDLTDLRQWACEVGSADFVGGG